MAAISSSSSQPPLDPWDQPIASTSSRRRVPAPIRDDWEDDDDEPQNEEDNQRIWDDANARASNPMPSLIISPSATSSRTVLSPPLGAFEPKMRILKRPSPSNSKSPTPTSVSTETLKEREARYQAARERIFGDDRGTVEGNPAPQPSREKKQGWSSQNGPTVAVVRNPRGPSEVSANNPNEVVQRGFGKQRANPPPTAQDFVGVGTPEGPSASGSI